MDRPEGDSRAGSVRPQQSDQRCAYHEAGHALVFCLTYYGDDPGGDERIFECLAIDASRPARGSIHRLDRGRRDPWKDALVCLGGHAAEDIVYGDQLEHYQTAQDDWRTAERLLRGLGMYEHARDAFHIARELLAHNRPILETMAEALAQNRFLDGHEIKAIFERNRVDDPGPARR